METPIITDTILLHGYISGALGGISGLIIGYPFDTTKVQLQTQSGHGYKGTRDALQHIHRQYGWTKGFLRGLSWPMLSYGAVNSVFFGVYGSSVKYFQWLRNNTSKSYLDIYLSGCIAGAAQLVIACPVDLIKVILQSQIQHNTSTKLSGKYFNSPSKCAKTVIENNSVRGLYKGVLAMMFRDIPSYGIYCLTYEYLTDIMHMHELTDSGGIISSLVAGGMAGTLSWSCIMPLDVIKSRWQADMDGVYKGLMDCVRSTVREGGVMALYKGTFITCLRAFPVNAVTFLVYSQSLKYFKS